MTRILANYPALTIIEDKDREFTDGDDIAVPYKSANHGTLYNFYRLGSVEDFARRNNEDVDVVLARAKQRGLDPYYAYGLAVSITAWKKEKKVVPAFSHGDVIRAFGKKFRIVPAPNQNIRLQEVE